MNTQSKVDRIVEAGKILQQIVEEIDLYPRTGRNRKIQMKLQAAIFSCVEVRLLLNAETQTTVKSKPA